MQNLFFVCKYLCIRHLYMYMKVIIKKMAHFIWQSAKQTPFLAFFKHFKALKTKYLYENQKPLKCQDFCLIIYIFKLNRCAFTYQKQQTKIFTFQNLPIEN